MADADGFVRGETLDIFIDILAESELDHLFEEEMDNIKHEVISYIYALIYFIKLLYFSRFLAKYFKSLCSQH